MRSASCAGVSTTESPEMPAPARLQGCFVSDKEIDRLVNWWREQAEASADEEQPQIEPVQPGRPFE